MRDSNFSGLQIDENLPFQRKAWRAQKLAFWVLLAIVALAAAGFFGTGPMSRTVREDAATPLRVHFERFVRYGAPNELRFELPGGVAKNGQVDLWLSREWVEAVRIDTIAPEPAESSSDPEGYTYSFKASDTSEVIPVIETTQQALLGEDFSVTNCFLLVIALIVTEIIIAKLKHKYPLVDRLVDGLPLVILEDGKPLKERMDNAKLDVSDLLAAARESQGLERLDQIKYAVLERSGGISIIPKSKD